MSGALSEDPGRPRLGAAARTVFRSELNPVDFLYRAAYLYPGQGRRHGVASGGTATSNWPNGRGGSPTRCLNRRMIVSGCGGLPSSLQNSTP